MRSIQIGCLFLAACQSAPEAPATVVAEGTPATVETEGMMSSITIKQRSSAKLSAPWESLRLSIDDITFGRVLVRLRSGDGDLVPMTAMSVGGSAKFEYAGREQMLALSRMENLLIGQDYAEFYLGDPEMVCRAQIETILERIEDSELKFLALGAETDGRAMAARLRRDYARVADEIRSGEEFVKRVATRPFPSAEDYRVRVLPGEGIRLSSWIRGR